MQGFKLFVRLSVTHKGEGKVSLGVYIINNDFAMGHRGRSVAINVKLCAKKGGEREPYSQRTSLVVRLDSKISWGRSTLFSEEPISCLDDLPEFRVNGHLKLRCTIASLDGRAFEDS